MRASRAVAIVLILAAVVAGASYAQDEGATITFTDTETLIFQGTGEMRAEAPMPCPVVVGNFRIIEVRLPSEANRDYVGLVIPFRGALNERMANLDPRWGGANPLALVCEVIDPSRPIGFRLRAHARAREVHSPGTWLELNLGRGPRDSAPIPATVQNRRINGDMQRWYVLSSIQEVYRKQDPERDRFAIMLDTGGRGSWWIKWLELKSWPTVIGEG